jgi:hypothetical protein
LQPCPVHYYAIFVLLSPMTPSQPPAHNCSTPCTTDIDPTLHSMDGLPASVTSVLLCPPSRFLGHAFPVVVPRCLACLVLPTRSAMMRFLSHAPVFLAFPTQPPLLLFALKLPRRLAPASDALSDTVYTDLLLLLLLKHSHSN